LLTDLWLWIEGIPPLAAIRTSTLWWPALSAAHIAAFGVMLGAIAAFDLAVLRGGPVAVMRPWVLPVAASGLAVAIVTGALLFGTRATLYAQNPAMGIKMTLLAMGLANVWAFRRLPDRWLPLSAALSLALWGATLVTGRWIAFV
jgi:hypothetical protein